MDADDALERLQAQLVTMNAPPELRRKLMAMAATCEEAYIPVAYETVAPVLQGIESLMKKERL